MRFYVIYSSNSQFNTAKVIKVIQIAGKYGTFHCKKVTSHTAGILD